MFLLRQVGYRKGKGVILLRHEGGLPKIGRMRPDRMDLARVALFSVLPNRQRYMARDLRRSKGAATVHSYDGDFLRVYPRRMIEPRGTKDKGHSPINHAKDYSPSTAIRAPAPKKLTRDELHERSAKG
ncbi:hypothetical protein BHE74_00022691 [Ensete ventricosum]|nr:hypothetical protein BHE74_00022691 [Ensete ventricosum]